MREVVRMLLSEVQVGGMKVEQVTLEVVRFSGDGAKGAAVLVGGAGVVRLGGKEDKVWFLADSSSAFLGHWRTLSQGEVMQVPVKMALQGEVLSGALVVWQRPGEYQGRFVSDEGGECTQGQRVVQGLAAAQPNLPSSEYIVDFYADPYFTEWVGSFIRLCNGATSREGIQDGFARTEETRQCTTSDGSQQCFVRDYCWDWNGDGKIELSECRDWKPVPCPCRLWNFGAWGECVVCPPNCPW